MRILVITQKVDRNDSNLGFFEEWLQRLAERVDHVYVICLQKGEYALDNTKVTVLTLGKEVGTSRLIRLCRFYRYIWTLRKQYDGVFIHMNPEYAVLGGVWWRLWHKKVLLWYVHKAVNVRLWLAEKFVTAIFTASPESFRLPSKKVIIVGHGINVVDFTNKESVPARPDEKNVPLVTVGRVSPSKDLRTLILAVDRLCTRGIPVHLTIVGEPITPVDRQYQRELEHLVRQRKLENIIRFVGKKAHGDIVGLYRTPAIFLHASRTGSLDKTVLEALAAGLPVVTSSEAFIKAMPEVISGVFPEGDAESLAKVIEKIWQAGILQQVPNERAQQYIQAHHNLDTVIAKIASYLEPSRIY